MVPAHVVGYIVPAPAVSYAVATVVEHIAPAPAVSFVAPAPAVYAAPAPVMSTSCQHLPCSWYFVRASTCCVRCASASGGVHHAGTRGRVHRAVSTAPVAEPTAMSFTVPSTGSTIVATAAVVTMCSASADCTDSATPMCSGSVCVSMSCGGESFSPDGAHVSSWDSVTPMTGKYTTNYSHYQEDVGWVFAE